MSAGQLLGRLSRMGLIELFDWGFILLIWGELNRNFMS